MKTLNFISRKSPLAIKQVSITLDYIQAKYPSITLTTQTISTEGDRFLNIDIAKLGGKGVFVTDLEKSMTKGKTDIAVHSLKDVPAQLDKQFTLFYLPIIADNKDVLIGSTLHELPQNATVGTSSLRRKCQLQQLRPDIIVTPIRGSVETRLNKLQNENFDAIILAKAGLERLQLTHLIDYEFTPEEMLPSPCQGVIGLQCLKTREDLCQLLSSIANDSQLNKRITAERKLCELLGGSCTLPLGTYTTITQNLINMQVVLFDPESNKILRSQAQHEDPIELAKLSSDALKKQNADQIIQKFQ